MRSKRQKYLSVVCGLLYVSASIYIEVGHTDVIESGIRTVQRLLSHDCSGRERHRPLSKDDQCPVCVRYSQTTAFVESSLYTATPATEVVRICLARNEFPRRERTISSVRGPPQSIV